MFAFREIWRALFSYYLCFQIRPCALLRTKKSKFDENFGFDFISFVIKTTKKIRKVVINFDLAYSD